MTDQTDRAETLITQMGMTGADIERRLQVVGFAPDDVKRVKDLADIVLGNLDELTAAFFDYLAAMPEAAGLMRNPAMLEAARTLKKAHLRAMVGGTFGASYVEERLKLGLLYAKADLEPRFFIGAFHHLMRTIGFKVMEQGAKHPLQSFENFMALKKVAFFDLSLIVDVIVFERERIIRLQQEALRELSTPVLQVRDRLLILPIIGVVDTLRARQLTESLLRAVRERRARVVVLDITGVPLVDSKVANHLMQTVMAAKLMGALAIVTGVSADVAQALVTLGVDLGNVRTVGDLQGGLEEAERVLGYVMVRESAERSAAGR